MNSFRASVLTFVLMLACSAHAGEPTRLTTDGRLKMDPVFVERGAAIVYTVQESPTQLSLYRLRLADGRPRRMHPTANTSELEPAFSSDGRYYAYVQSVGNLKLRLVIKDVTNNTEAVFQPKGGFSGLHNPVFAPNGSRIAFSIPSEGGQQLVSIDVNARNRKTITQSASVNNWPDFSPDGNSIAFASSRDGDFEIYVTDSDGAKTRRLTARPGRDVRPTFSPDGQQIAFTGTHIGSADSTDVFVMPSSGGTAINVTHHPERDDYAAWQPDGRRLVTVSERGGQFDLYLFDAPTNVASQ